MTAKEKCKELLHKMNNVDLNCDNESMCMLYPHAIECAIIAVDEILKPSFNDYVKMKSITRYWEEVKKEILIIKNK